ncbi:MAG: T9SS type A sorting domain-containing protein [Candidatus Kapabacteria bacterium]|nr:T9SS type A sorting domain-containing protein [Candidatus Kapabacteria bacterium]
MKKCFIYLLVLVFALSLNFSYSTEALLKLIPNGKQYSCLNCHTVMTGGEGTVHLFGKAFNTNKRIWNAKLAALDSDGDGFTNGQELQDVKGVWKVGGADPGNPNYVTNPSNKDDFPASVEQIENFSFEILNLFPLPVKVDFSLALNIKRAGLLDISLYSIDGRFISSLFTGEKAEGEYNFNFNLLNQYNSNLLDGVYFIEVKQNYAILRKRFVINK